MRTDELRGEIEKISALLELYKEEAEKTFSKEEAETKKVEIAVTKEQLLDELLKTRRLLKDMEQETENI